jgi:hypothetical protein
MRSIGSSDFRRAAKAFPQILIGASFLAAGVFGQVPAAQAAVVTKRFDFQLPSLDELYRLVIKYDNSSTVTKTVTEPVLPPPEPNDLTNPGVVTPINPADPSATPTTSTPLLSAAPYTFTGYEILDISGFVYVLSTGALEGAIKYNPNPLADGGTNAEVVGVFNYLCGVETPANPSCPGYPIDLIAHAKPDNLFNPGGIAGLGFSATPSLPSQYLDNFISFGGFAFDVFEESVAGSNIYDKFHGPYQLFTVSAGGVSGNNTPLKAGDYAGCPGSCVKSEPVPGPLPLVGVGAAFGFSRRLRKRITISKAPDLISGIG